MNEANSVTVPYIIPPTFNPVDVSLVALVNRVRSCADQWSKSYSDAKRMLLEWEIKGYAATVPDDENTLVVANMYGIQAEPITGRELHDIIRVCQVVVGFCENGNPLFANKNEAGETISLRKPISAIVKVATNGAFS